MFGSLKSRHFIFAAVLVVLSFYQNCSDDGSSDDSLDSSSYESTLPFAYNPAIDTVAYMSCSNISSTSFEPRAYFTFRAGAYTPNSSGLGMTTNYYNATQYYTSTARGQTLGNSSNNSNTLMSLSIRSTSNFQSIWATQAVTAGNEIDAMLPVSLDSPEIAGPFSAQAQSNFTNYFPSSDQVRLIEGSLRFLQYENVASDTRNNLQSQTSMLVVGFSASADSLDQTLRTPLDFPSPLTPLPNPPPNYNTTAFGYGYMINFSLPSGYVAGDQRVIAFNNAGTSAGQQPGLQEQSLTTNLPTYSSWDCDPNWEFMVIRPEDLVAGLVACNTQVDSFSTAAQQAELAAIRRVLRVEDWFVDVVNHCIVPKAAGGDVCYGTSLGTQGQVAIQYGVNPNGQLSCADTATTICPHFVSVCIRQ